MTKLLGNKVKAPNERFELWLLTVNFYNNNFVTNIGDINYTNEEEKLNKFILIRPIQPFLDNIMIVNITDSIGYKRVLKTGKFLVRNEDFGSFKIKVIIETCNITYK